MGKLNVPEGGLRLAFKSRPSEQRILERWEGGELRTLPTFFFEADNSKSRNLSENCE